VVQGTGLENRWEQLHRGFESHPIRQIANALAGRYADLIFALSAVPMLATSFDEAETLLRIARPYYGAALARHNQVLLATWTWRPGALWSRLAIHSPADIAGRDFTVGGYFTEGWAAPFERLGARFAPAIADMVLAAGAKGSSSLDALVYRNFTEICIVAQLIFLTVNQDFLASLPAVHRQGLIAAGRECETAQWQLKRESIQLDHDDMAAEGVSVVSVPPKDLMDALRSAAEPDIQDWARSAGADGAAIIASYRRAIGRG
jgi:TRAP-type C4-dicarboxylate transport system substrate-binding protein